MSAFHNFRLPIGCALILSFTALPASAELKIHGIFGSHMVIQRDKPIKIWGWASPGESVSVSFGGESATAEATDGSWQVEFPSREANAQGVTLTVSSGDQSISFEDILIGDVWVMNGQSNMAWALSSTSEFDMEAAQADLPLLRRIGIRENESETLQTDIPADRIVPWRVATPETVGSFGSIGFSFASRIQRALGIPIGIIDNARGGASIESLVPRHKFAEHPKAAAYLAFLEKQIAEFDWDAELERQVARWEQDVARRRERGEDDDRMPPRPTMEDSDSWSVVGRTSNDAATCYNGMFGVFKGLNIKGVLFHQGFNNALPQVCRPKRYRVLMKLMIEGWREDFNDPNLPVGVIEFCAAGIPQTRENFEVWSHAGAAYIREAQRLSVEDLNDPENIGFIPGYDVQYPLLHPPLKMTHGVRAARWALATVYQHRFGNNTVNWETAELVSAERHGDRMILTFDKPVMPHNMSLTVEGFSIADASGRFHMAHAAQPLSRDDGIWNSARNIDGTRVHVWSPLVSEPVAVRYAWSASPMGNLKINGREWLPLQSFRTDEWDWPESDDPAETLVGRAEQNAFMNEAAERLGHRRRTEAEMGLEVVERLKSLHEAP